jgi:chemotaxis protein methyltransferase CheR
MIGEDQPIALTVAADDGMIGSDKAVSIGLIVTELVINAFKYAFPAEKPDAVVNVSYASRGDDWTLVVADNGVGSIATPVADAPGGLGGIIVKALVQQLSARMETVSAPAGLSITITRQSDQSPLSKAA